MEQALAEAGKFDVYNNYFSFSGDVIREESEPTLREIAQVSTRHPDWKLRVNGHADSVGGDAYILDFSMRRATAVKDALVRRYHVDAARLSNGGFGRAQPKDTNATLVGRARNRRVERMRG
jgi:outer membrane protein OmpA-like peptidoglycan-associated protein